MRGGGGAGDPLIVAIDGPAGVGKSTAAKMLAERLEVPYLDTGAMYRAIALAVLDSGHDPDDREAVLEIAERADVSLRGEADGRFVVLLEGEPVESRIRAPEVGEGASKVSIHPEVRERMVALQRASAQQFGAVLEGRDIGTKVFPDTPHKFFVTARPEIRVQRRYEQLRGMGREIERSEIEREVEQRDARDAGRDASPLTHDDSYTVVDTSDLRIDEVVDRMERAVHLASLSSVGWQVPVHAQDRPDPPYYRTVSIATHGTRLETELKDALWQFVQDKDPSVQLGELKIRAGTDIIIAISAGVAANLVTDLIKYAAAQLRERIEERGRPAIYISPQYGPARVLRLPEQENEALRHFRLFPPDSSDSKEQQAE